jgi:hypothetical protein
MDEVATHSYLYVIIRYQYFVFITATAENPVSHKCVVTEGSKTFTALSDKLEESLFTNI